MAEQFPNLKLRPTSYNFPRPHDLSAFQSFDRSTLPWLDRPDYEAVLRERQRKGEISGDTEYLKSWAQNGFLHFPKLIEPEKIDRFWHDVDRAWAQRPNVPLFVGREGSEPAILPQFREKPKHYRFFNFHLFSTHCLGLALDSRIVKILSALFGETPVLMQTLTYEFGSEQALHVDYLPVRAAIPSHLIVSWIACEDVDEASGPLVYYPGSHRIDPAGMFEKRFNEFFPADRMVPFPAYLMARCFEMKLERRELFAKKGDVFFWHAALIHGGAERKQPNATRKSLVTHYSTIRGYPRCNFYEDTEMEFLGDAGYFAVEETLKK